ncbi:MAG TPA: hypothetical protein VHR41_02280 [Gemmatimonadales bacterium]|jgi:hypothetical protein|nr:hypothetical protein [Gemmatimonadales bacterium]
MRALVRPLLLALLFGACSHGGGSPQPAPDRNAGATVEVENQDFADMTIYVLPKGTRVRLGLAGGHSTTRLPIPAYVLQPGLQLRFLADPIGGSREPVSEEISVEPGETVELTIPAQSL